MADAGMSALVFGGSSQFVAVSLHWRRRGVASIIWLTTFVVNLRHALYSATPCPDARRIASTFGARALAFGCTDEDVCRWRENQLRHHASARSGRTTGSGSSLAMYFNWQVWTIVGVVLRARRSRARWRWARTLPWRQLLPPSSLQLRNRPILFAALVAGAVALLARWTSVQDGADACRL